MELVRAPERFEVIVTNNLFGDIVTDLGAQIAGGIGLAASGNIHPGGAALFEPVHGSAPDIAGQGVANPLATILSIQMLLEHLGHPRAPPPASTPPCAAPSPKRYSPGSSAATARPHRSGTSSPLPSEPPPDGDTR